MTALIRSGAVEILTVLSFFSTAAEAGVLNYDVIYVRQPRFGPKHNTVWPEVFHPARLDPGASLMLLRPDGTEEELVPAGNGAVTDPFLSFDAEWCYYSFFPDLRASALNYQRNDLPYGGCDIYRIHLRSRRIERLTFQEFTPNTGAAQWNYAEPARTSFTFTSLGYGILNLGPCPVPGGKVAFVSNRNAFTPPKNYTAPTLQLFVMDEDGKNVTPIAPMTIGSALHPTPLQDGRLMFSSYESQGLRDQRMWGIWTIWPDGRVWEPLVSAFHGGQAFHFMTQVSNGEVVVVDYYNLNNNGFGALFKLPPAAPIGQPQFYSAFPKDNPPLEQTVGAGFQYPFKMPFTPRGMVAMTPFTHPQDEAAPQGKDGTRVGKFTQPSGAPDNDLLVVWTAGPANDLNRPTTQPYYDAGIYLIRGSITVTNPAQLVLIKNSPDFNEAWPRAVVPWKAVHGKNEPTSLPWLPNDGALHAELPPGTPYGLVGTSSFYKRESFPGIVTPWGNGFDGLDAFNTSENGQSSNWEFQGSDAGLYSNSEIYAVRLVAMEPNSHRSYGPNSGGPYNDGNHFVSHARERLRILGEIPLRKRDESGGPILDPEGNPDTSFMAKIHADTPFTFQMLNQDGLVLTMAQTWHQVRPGEVRNNCGGCHAHSQQPLSIDRTVAGKPGYQPFDLTRMVTLLSKDAEGITVLKTNPPGAVNVEYIRNIRPVLQRSCVPCHTKSAATPPGNLVLDDLGVYGGLPGDYKRLADDTDARWGYKPVIPSGTWRQSNASRYVRMFQSRRSLLIWKLFGRRLDGWTNADHPTESVPGDPATLPAKADPNMADLDYTGQPMPPPDSIVPPLSEDEKMMFARWVDLGCPIDTGSAEDSKFGWFLDELRPTLTVSSPRQNRHAGPLAELRVGIADAYSGVNLETLSIKADFPVNGELAGSELVRQGSFVAPGVFSIPIKTPIQNLGKQHLTASVADRQGNTNRVQVRFWVESGYRIVALEVAEMKNRRLTVRVAGAEPATPLTILASPDINRPLNEWVSLPIVSWTDEPGGTTRMQFDLTDGRFENSFFRIESR